ncbi:hypothetical protein ACVWWK_007087 [Bradyrhizobium sp. LB9.1b]
MLRRLCHRGPQNRAELPERLRRHRLKQRLAIGKMPVGRRLGDAELFCKRLDADRLRSALLRLAQRSLDQGVPEIAMVVGVLGFSGKL